ncbi:MAG: glycosyltransferase family 2 protein [Elusimicrobiaceae bacterium]|nr:glycosyltransferase family 2 protein [Elusimicrobiaceae bacterium]
MKKIALLVPLYNEQEVLPLFWQKTQQVIQSVEDFCFEYIFVNDGSTDDTLRLLKDLADGNTPVKIISLARNFGKEAALTAGLAQAAKADATIVLDADLQDPPELIIDFVEKFKQGYDTIYACRKDRQKDSFFKRVSAGAFYRVYNALAERPIPPDAGDCRLISRRVAEAVLSLPERERFMKGLFSWVGFKTTSVAYVRPERAAGKTKWNYWKLWNFALSGITASGSLPLKLWTYFGLALSVFAFIYAMIVAGKKIFLGNPVSGYSSLMVTILFFSGVQLISLGVIGEYLSRIFVEVKARPPYIVDEKINCDD